MSSRDAAAGAGLIEVALPVPVPRTFLYRTPTPLAPGTRVLVPFGRRRLIGWAVGGPARGRDVPARVRSVADVLEDEPSVSSELLALARWIADYYLASLGQVLRAALPAGLSAPARPDPAARTRRVLRLVGDPPGLLERDALFGRARRQRELFEWLENAGRTADVASLREAGYSASVIDGLVGRGVARIDDEADPRDPFAADDDGPAPRLRPTPAQAAAVAEAVSALESAGASPPLPYLLRGVTGSGKTLVYIELLRHVVEERGRGAIVLVPEIALTPQTVARFRGAFGDRVAVLHSALSDGERFDAWSALRAGEKRIAVGARSAVFAPVPNLGAIVVDEEHEGSYKQSETPRYHAREVAIMRARAARALCLLGSATPSMESWHNAAIGKFRLLTLPDRVADRPLPPVRTIDLRARSADAGRSATPGSAAPSGGRGPGILSEPLTEALRQRLARDEQSILLLNRRGYATFLQCRGCGDVLQCPRCNVSLTYHRGRRRLVCHYCAHAEPPPRTCARCGSDVVRYRGYGTEQVERAVYEAFPEARIARMDVDTTGEKWSHHRILDRVRRREVDILLGTQMIAKGLDFPNVTLVGVVNADVGLNLPDFRAAERTFQLLTQVAGRAGRGPAGGEVLIQTAHPAHYAIRAAQGHDYDAFVAREQEERKGPGYPPFGRLTNVIVTGTAEAAVQEHATSIARDAARQLGALRATSVEILGPAPCPIDRIRDRWRWHLLLRAAEPGPLGRVSRWLLEACADRVGGTDVRVSLDRDPLALL
ncbi:MAG TPA: primosomal protein N' [Longimicrobiales bacterium]|nr:primosomal protein N' [Longimicrobiales bacterium]